MKTDPALNTLREHGETHCTLQFWGTDTPSRSFDTAREALRFLADERLAEPLPDLHIHAAAGDLAINGPELEHLIAVAKAQRD